jgi:uncharacterized protein (TIRG00374 family)
MKTKAFAKILAVVITLVLISILLSQISIGDVVKTLASLDPVFVVLGFVFYLFSYLFRALRFQVLLNKKVNLHDLFTIVCVHNMVNNILPARTGELSYVYLVKKSVSTGEGIATLTIARIFDVMVISILFFISGIMLGELPVVISDAFLVIAIFLIIVVSLLIISIYKSKDFMDNTERIANKYNLKRFRGAEFLIEKGNETASSFAVIQSKKVFFYSFLFSLFLWVFQFYSNYVLLKAMDINLPIASVVLGSTLSLFANILPIPNIGAFGVYEGAWTISFMSLGMSKEMAITSGFVTHIATIAYFLVLGGYGLAMRYWKWIDHKK